MPSKAKATTIAWDKTRNLPLEDRKYVRSWESVSLHRLLLLSCMIYDTKIISHMMFYNYISYLSFGAGRICFCHRLWATGDGYLSKSKTLGWSPRRPTPDASKVQLWIEWERTVPGHTKVSCGANMCQPSTLPKMDNKWTPTVEVPDA